MARAVNVGVQSFERARSRGQFLQDKTSFIGAWWRGGDDMTLICRPRRFGKTLTLSMVECFLSNLRDRAKTRRLFEGLDVSCDPEMMEHMGTVPVVLVSFANAGGSTFGEAASNVKVVLWDVVSRHLDYLLGSPGVDVGDKRLLSQVTPTMDDITAQNCLRQLCDVLRDHWGTKPVVLLDEYDTPLVEAWAHGYLDEMDTFLDGLLSSTFRDNPSLGRGLIVGIVPVALDFILSGKRCARVVTASTPRYETAFGFTADEVASALEEFGLEGRMGDMVSWYEGYTFGTSPGIYNPWSIVNVCKDGRLGRWWTGTSSNGLVSTLVGRGDEVAGGLERLVRGETVTVSLKETIDLRDLELRPDAVWALLLATGYLTLDPGSLGTANAGILSLSIPNLEIRGMFQDMVAGIVSRAGKCS